jgi:transposase
VLSPLMFEGYCNSALIEAWFQKHLLHELQPGQVVILDNASFHCKNRLRQVLATVGCTLLPLPPYSPDLNKIEPGALWADVGCTQ